VARKSSNQSVRHLQAQQKLRAAQAAPRIDPKLQRALDLQAKGDLDAAHSLFTELLSHSGAEVAASYSLGVIAFGREQLDEALGYFERSIRVAPHFEQARSARDAVLHRKAVAQARESGNNLRPAEEELPNSATHDPRLARALICHETGRQDEAKSLFESLLQDHPSDFASHYSLCAIHAARGEPRIALSHIDQAIAAAPKHVGARFARGTVRLALGHHGAAIASFDEALALDPQNVEALLNKSTTLHGLRKVVEATECLKRILEINPKHEKALGNLGYMLTELNANDQAAEIFARLLAVNPHYDYAEGLLVKARMHCCDWTDYEQSCARIEEGLLAGRRSCNSLAIMALTDDPELHLQAARLWSAHRCPPRPNPLWQGEVYRHGRTRLAYISPDFREHPVGYSFCGVLEAHSTSRFELFGISLGPDDQSEFRKRYKLAFDHFIDAQTMSAAEIAQWIRAMEIDILVDLAGYTAGSRTDVLAMRPAPIQVNYLGYPGTMAAPYIDYIIADEIVLPETHRAFFSEVPAYLPSPYLPADDSIQASDQRVSRQQHGLPEQGFVYCSFNHDYKINPHIFQVWMEILEAVPGSILWLMKLNAHAEANLRKEAQQRGVSQDRLYFAQRVPDVRDHLARYQLVDVFLDTFPYNAHSTARDAIRMGVPVLTLCGRSFPSRVATSIIKPFDVPELICENFHDYREKAVNFGKHPSVLSQLRERLKQQVKQSEDQTPASQAKHLELLYHRMIQVRDGPQAQ